ncbi:MAG: hypothetical protein AMQ74_01931 [Candidatus Methanofastidiosum methylothiophilum]|uniref:Uncharacterized protein n=1 Tax=Candidatus Methanofastidiosum methylothiophilum TaxID=1705564 RepID=A0A150IIK7_9EURY|nr:MAG: hypothetical protein AMQ74_01931 [Candidatus Methanofastidiosum methylthiophilus]
MDQHIQEQYAIDSIRDKNKEELAREAVAKLRHIEKEMLYGGISNKVTQGLKKIGDNPGAILRYFGEYIDEMTKDTPCLETLEEKIIQINKWHEEIKKYGFGID